MLLTLQKDQGYNEYPSDFQPFSGQMSFFQQTFTATENSVNYHQNFQQNERQIQPQIASLNIRPRRRRNCQSLVSTMDPVAVARRNERERNRVKQVNDGFNELRKKIPYIPEKKKFSKVEILRFAMMYIKELQRVIDEAGAIEETGSTSAEETMSHKASNSTIFEEAMP